MSRVFILAFCCFSDSVLCFSIHSAIIEHTNKVLYLEDDDIAVVTGGKLSIHRINRQAGEDPVRAIQTLQMEMQQIMKGQMMTDIKSMKLVLVSLYQNSINIYNLKQKIKK